MIQVTLTFIKENKRTCTYENKEGGYDRLPPVQQLYVNKAALISEMENSQARPTVPGLTPGSKWPASITIVVSI